MYIGKLNFGRLIQLPHTIKLKKRKEVDGAIETRDQRPETRDQRPETKRPETRDQRPKTRDQRPKTRDQRPETIKYTLLQDVSFVYKRRTPLPKPLRKHWESGVVTLLQSRRVWVPFPCPRAKSMVNLY